MPDGADAVAALDAVQTRGAQVSALAAVAPGEGVLARGRRRRRGLALRLAGARLRRIDVALLTALGIERVLVRQPRVRVVRVGAGHDHRRRGGADRQPPSTAKAASPCSDDIALEAALTDDGEDMVVAIGGTGSGTQRHERAHARARRPRRVPRHRHHAGRDHGDRIRRPAPVLLLPGRIDAALAGWLTVGRRMLARRAFRLIEEQPFAAELARKIASPLGLAEVVAVRRRLGKVEPVAQGYLSMQALAHAEGWILIPADSEGHPAGARVVVRPWP